MFMFIQRGKNLILLISSNIWYRQYGTIYSLSGPQFLHCRQVTAEKIKQWTLNSIPRMSPSTSGHFERSSIIIARGDNSTSAVARSWWPWLLRWPLIYSLTFLCLNKHKYRTHDEVNRTVKSLCSLRDLKADRSKRVSLKTVLVIMREGVKLQTPSVVAITLIT